MRKQADFQRPYEILEHMLTQEGGRKRMLARLGPEAEDPIDELLTQALDYESRETPSLAGFGVSMPFSSASSSPSPSRPKPALET